MTETGSHATHGAEHNLSLLPTAQESSPPQETIHFDETFTPEQKAWITALMDATGLPTNTRTATYRPEEYGRTLATYRYRDGMITVNGSISQLPPEAQAGTFAHEMYGHGLCPFTNPNPELYGGQEQLEALQWFVIDVANQSLTTNKWLDGYQKHLATQLRAGQIDAAAFLRETWAILMDQILTNPKHLQQVETAQARKLERLKGAGLVQKETKALAIVAPIKVFLINMIPKVSNEAELDQHLAAYRQLFKVDSTPFSASNNSMIKETVSLLSLPASAPLQPANNGKGSIAKAA